MAKLIFLILSCAVVIISALPQPNSDSGASAPPPPPPPSPPGGFFNRLFDTSGSDSGKKVEATGSSEDGDEAKNADNGEPDDKPTAVDSKDDSKTDRKPTSSAFVVGGPPMVCPPCPCLPPVGVPMPPYTFLPPLYLPGVRPFSKKDKKRNRRAVTSDDYWHGTGPNNAYLMQTNPGYYVQSVWRDQYKNFGPSLHVGKVQPSDFNYPSDFTLFEEPGYEVINIDQNVVYELTGPLEVSPAGDLTPINVPTADAFAKLTLYSGFYRLVSVQKNGIMRIADVTNSALFIVDCTKQRLGSCQNLKPKSNLHDFPKFYPKLNRVYRLVGLLDASTVQNGSPNVILSPDTPRDYKVTSITSATRFSLTQSPTNVVYFIDCNRQKNGACESLREN